MKGMIGDRIRLLRSEKGLTRQDLADAAGLSAGAIEQYEDGRWRPGSDTIARLASALQVTVVDLVEDCDALRQQNGDVILVEKNSGCRLKVFGVIKNAGNLMA
jgi:transcriptional regulator with XRE-family HTH domain